MFIGSPQLQLPCSRNTHGSLTRMSRLLHYNLPAPIHEAIVPDANFFFNNPYVDLDIFGKEGEDPYSEAKSMPASEPQGSRGGLAWNWHGRFFPDMGAWDKLHDATQERGAGGHRVGVQAQVPPCGAICPSFPLRRTRRGTATALASSSSSPAGRATPSCGRRAASVLSSPGMRPASSVPPNRWFHQHFERGQGVPARYLAFQQRPGPPARVYAPRRRVQRDQFEYPDEDPFVIREKFESGAGPAWHDQPHARPRLHRSDLVRLDLTTFDELAWRGIVIDAGSQHIVERPLVSCMPT